MFFCPLLSSGKDSNYALMWAILHGFKPKCVITFYSSRDDSYMLQTINTELASLQAEALGLKHYWIRVSGLKEIEVDEIRKGLERILRTEDFTYVTTGALRSDYQKVRFYSVFNELGLKPISPQWWCDQGKYLERLVDYGVEFILTRVAAYGLPVEFIGKIVEREMVERILLLASKYGFNPAFEGGEAETLVLYTPLYKKRLCIEGEIIRKGFGGELLIKKAWLGDNSSGDRCLIIR
ncbi:MAG: diphthine--ammonia ligase [Desulfurococcales archaeon]|nr:diphthine--ammonia ligase [Desulfurococcales archaeon]